MKTKRKELLKNSQLQEPRFAIFINKKRYVSTAYVGKISYFISNEAKDFIDKGIPIRFRTIYGKAKTQNGAVEIITNEMVCHTMEDLQWAFEAFRDRGLYLKTI